MNENRLSQLFEVAADRVPPTSPPLPDIVAGAQRHRRRRMILGTLPAGAAVAGILAASAVLLPHRDAVEPPRPASSPSVVVPPAGTRLVGLSHAAIAVPKDWGTDQIQCGVPQRDTVVLDVGATPTCVVARPQGVDSVEVFRGEPRSDFHADRSETIDGVRVQRQDTACISLQTRANLMCAGTVYVPSMKVNFRAESSTSGREVDRILGWIRMVPGEVGVPGYQDVNIDHQATAGQHYAVVLKEAGLIPVMRTRTAAELPAGLILDVSPQPGTVLREGAKVTVTVAAR